MSTAKTFFKYWGGKTNMAPYVLKYMPTHKVYVEPFCGSAAILFEKPRSKTEVINDINHHLINFYRVAQKYPKALANLCRSMPYSRALYTLCLKTYNENIPSDFIDQEPRKAILYASRFYYLANTSHSGKIAGGWAIGKTGGGAHVNWFDGKKITVERTCKRIDGCYIENRDAIKVIETWDREDTWFYCDPPYIGSVLGHYSGYEMNSFKKLLRCLEGIKGKFMLSMYPNKTMSEFAKKNKWIVREIDLTISVDKSRNEKTEVLVYNYDDIENGLFS